ncbi:hypothetical protein ACCUM_4271 [Candidatus Accumulibacter phosphatis]|uniref:Uncharacterized protein n=1 Tax=Candidatus Accumulibacter phosphatis TaxID=327160 RepID=A0A5S4EMD2_9PROT|nr:hypothetical protein ACCUM_4271 [Candidatus Accumulibacter phosphatis]
MLPVDCPAPGLTLRADLERAWEHPAASCETRMDASTG